MWIDTDARWFGFRDDQENQAGSAGNVQLLQPYIAKEGTVLLNRHGRKSGGNANDAGRGSSAIDGAVDYILHLTKPQGQDPDVRQIDCVGRFEMPERLLIRRRPNFQLSHPIGNGDVEVPAPRFVYQLASTQAPSTKAKIRSELLKGAKTVKQLAGVLGVSPQTINRTLEDMAGEVIQVGKGGPKKNAVLSGLREKGTLPSQSLRDGEVESSDLDPLAA